MIAPLLFVFYLDEVLKKAEEEGAEVVAYADDVAMVLRD